MAVTLMSFLSYWLIDHVLWYIGCCKCAHVLMYMHMSYMECAILGTRHISFMSCSLHALYIPPSRGFFLAPLGLLLRMEMCTHVCRGTRCIYLWSEQQFGTAGRQVLWVLSPLLVCPYYRAKQHQGYENEQYVHYCDFVLEHSISDYHQETKTSHKINMHVQFTKYDTPENRSHIMAEYACM